MGGSKGLRAYSSEGHIPLPLGCGGCIGIEILGSFLIPELEAFLEEMKVCAALSEEIKCVCKR